MTIRGPVTGYICEVSKFNPTMSGGYANLRRAAANLISVDSPYVIL